MVKIVFWKVGIHVLPNKKGTELPVSEYKRLVKEEEVRQWS
jgi:hypothetical protein